MDADWDAVFWDIGGVILDPDSVRSAHRTFVRSLDDRHGLDVPVGDAVSEWRSELGAYFRERDDTEFRPARAGYARAVSAVAGADLPEAAWRPLLTRAFLAEFRPTPNVCETLSELASRDLHLGIVSDVDTQEGLLILAQFGLLDRFDSITTSEEVGATKPAPEMFATALAKAEADPERSLMIGDRYAHDVEGAARHGIATVAYTAADGPAVDYRVSDLAAVVDVVDRGRSGE